MFFAVHMENKKTKEKRVYKCEADIIDKATAPDFGYGRDWIWTGTEPFSNVEKKVKPIKPFSSYYVALEN